jgi:hypothetical protein
MSSALRLALAALLLAAACASLAGEPDIHTFLDRSTGTTLRITGAPWVLALDQPHLAAHARDYVAMHAVEVSNGGQRQYFIAALYWSTVPARNRHAGNRPGLRLLLDDRDISLQPAAQSLREAGIGRWPLRLPGRDALLILYAAETQLLRQLGHAGRLRARPEPESGPAPDAWFETWRDGRGPFRDFAGAVLPQP